MLFVNQLLANVPILYLLRTGKPGVFRGYKMGTLARNALMFTDSY